MIKLRAKFLGAWPGTGLLLLRLAATIFLIIAASVELRDGPHSAFSFAAQFVAIGVAVLLLAGLWTPVAGVLQAVIELWIVSSRGAATPHLLLAILAISLVMLGPGAWSVDARLFGRKRIDIRRR